MLQKLLSAFDKTISTWGHYKLKLSNKRGYYMTYKNEFVKDKHYNSVYWSEMDEAEAVRHFTYLAKGDYANWGKDRGEKC